MCGISGLLNCGDQSILEQMTDVFAYRGPDDRGVWFAKTAEGGILGLGSRRLAIQDLSSSGHMPMSTENGRYTIVYNGEIYNYPTLRAELEANGCRLRSHSDTEAILLLYAQMGPACLDRLNGMFAIAIWDAHRRELFIARDHLGIKPLYYFHQGNKLAFASEAKALLLLPEIERSINPEALRHYLSFLWVPEPLTMFNGIAKLPAGHFAVFRGGELRIERYWDLEFPSEDADYVSDERELAAQVRERFISTVKSQMLSDVPVGAFLSAGLDSSSIVAAMSATTEQPVKTFTISFPSEHRHGEILDDACVARRTAEHFHCHHTEIVVKPEVSKLLPNLIWHMDDPTADPAIITAYLVAKEAKEKATVLLSGVGGDEIFAGYRKYQAHLWAERYRRIPQPLRSGMIEPLIEKLPTFRGTPLRRPVRLAKKMVRSGSLPPRRRFIADSVYLSDVEQRKLLTNVQWDAWTGDTTWRHESHLDNVQHADFINQMLYLDSKMFMPSLNLNYNDKMSMACSVEVRVPFLDRWFVEWAAKSVAPQFKLHSGQTKYILRRAMESILPAEVLRQPKAGFGAPIDYWLAYDLRELVGDTLSSDMIAKRGLFEPSVIRRYVTEQRAGQRDWSYQIWSLLTLELWMQQFLDRRP